MTCYICDGKCDSFVWMKIRVGKVSVEAAVCKKCASEYKE